ncbi:MAG: GNAT family N-acetyltransferase, partial [Hydrogenophaga sp.]|nr:GNAT family N-acetyltransferase [Hydrogenophaga sp.]
VGELMLAEVEAIARERGACKLTLEVLQGNTPAIKLYERIGFAGYQLDPTLGSAQFLQKWLG